MSVKGIQLMERDVDFLKLLSRFGVVYMVDAKEKIYTSSRYYRLRLKQLEDANYIIRYKGKMVYLGFKGIDYLESIGIKPRSINSKIEYRKKLADIYKLSTELTLFGFETSSEVREKKYNVLATKRYRFYCKLSDVDQNEYYLYKITSMKNAKSSESIINGKKLDIANIKSDIADRVSESPVDVNVIILCEDEKVLSLYKDNKTQLNLGKELVMEYTEDAVNLLNDVVAHGLNSNNIVNVLLSRAGVKSSLAGNQSEADFNLIIDGKEYKGLNCTDNNFRKEKWLKGYMDFMNNVDAFAVVCYEELEEYYKKLMPGIKVITLEKPLPIIN